MSPATARRRQKKDDNVVVRTPFRSRWRGGVRCGERCGDRSLRAWPVIFGRAAHDLGPCIKNLEFKLPAGTLLGH